MEVKGYSTLWKSVIRPPRFEYDVKDLGPKTLKIGGKRITRTDLELKGFKQ
jgi:hypothetical protein